MYEGSHIGKNSAKETMTLILAKRIRNGWSQATEAQRAAEGRKKTQELAALLFARRYNN